MTDKEKLKRTKKLADAMYYAAQYLTTDASHLRKAMKEYHNFIVTEYNEENPVSKDLEQAAIDYCSGNKGADARVRAGFIMGAKWKEDQFEKERLKHCDALTAEQAHMESDFVTSHLKKHNRTPTFIDAIEYGMRLQKEQIMKDAIECEVRVDAGGYPYIPQLELWDYDEDVPLVEKGDKVKVIIIKSE